MLRIAIIAVLAVSVAGVSGCAKLGIGKNRSEITFDGHAFRGHAKGDRGKEPVHFVATVRGVSKSMDGAVQAAEYQGIRHCLAHYGTSSIDWDVGPDTPRDALVTENDTLTFMGTCRDL